MKFVPTGPIDRKAALGQVVAWHRTGDKPLPESMLTQFTDAYMRQYGLSDNQLRESGNEMTSTAIRAH